MRRLRGTVGWIAAVGLSAAYGVILGPFLVNSLVGQGNINSLTRLIPATFCFLLMLSYLVSVLCRKKRWDSNGYGRAVLLAILTGGLIFLTHDAPPIPNDFDEKDVICQDPKISASYPVYMTFRKEDDSKTERYHQPSLTSSVLVKGVPSQS